MDKGKRVAGAVTVLAIAIAAGMPATGSTAAGATKTGKITMNTEVTLNFPAPGNYRGKVKTTGRAKVKRVAKHNGTVASGKKLRKAKDEVAKTCRNLKSINLVTVHHLPKDGPKFLIGKEAPFTEGAPFEYHISGDEPPTGDDVRARSGKRTAVFEVGKHKWKAICPTATKTAAYPH